MSEQLSALIKLRDQAFADLARAKREMDKAKTKAKEVEMKYNTLAEAVSHIEGLDSAPNDSSRKDRIHKIILAHNGDGMTARDILDILEKEGLAPPGENPSASVHVAADQLAKACLIKSVKDPVRGKLYTPLDIDIDDL